jgi:hypothetical protein
MPRYFTREAAEALLPQIEPVLREIQAMRAELASQALEVQQRRAHVMGNGHVHPEETQAQVHQVARLSAELDRRLEQLAALGVLVKDLDSGLIDFPALRDGQEVYLCWRLGEGERIAWWHEIEAGFAGRQPLED